MRVARVAESTGGVVRGIGSLLVFFVVAGAGVARADDRLAGGLPGAVSLPAGAFQVSWDPGGGGVLRVTHTAEPGRVLWGSRPGLVFVTAAVDATRITGERGFVQLRERLGARSAEQTVEAIETVAAGVRVRGQLLGRTPARYALTFSAVDDRQLRFELSVEPGPGYDRAGLVGASQPDERFLGFGEQFTHLDLKGRRVPICVREQGIGRGVQPLSFLLNRFAGGAGGDWSTTYAPVPFTLSSLGRGLCLEADEVSFFDLTDPEAIAVEVLAPTFSGRILYGASPLEVIEAYTRYAGRMQPLPDWAHAGLIVGAVGGAERIRRLEATLRGHGVEVSGFFLQDWVGERETPFGTRLWWHWQPDPRPYPDWPGFVRELRNQGYRVLSYANPWLVEAGSRPGVTRDLYGEAEARGFLVREASGRTYRIDQAGFDAALVDLSNPAAFDWLKELLKTELLASGVSGWMGDFGEALPFDAQLQQGEARRFHNRYPEAWQRLQREAVAEAGQTGDVVFFSRSGYTRSPGLTTLFWLGDQLCSWDRHDGLRSALTGLLSSGISGFALNHGDAGGYTNVRVGPLVFYRRSKELLQRWVELCAFTAMLRTHEGLVPGAAGGAQLDGDAETLAHLARMSRVFRLLAPYRRQLMQEAAQRGWPLVRHPWLHHPGRPELLGASDTFLLGAELLVAPALRPGQRSVEVLLPPGRWVLVWDDQQVFGDPARPMRARIPAPVGEPAVLHRAGSTVGLDFVRALDAAGLR